MSKWEDAKRWDTQQDASWIDLRGFILAQLVLHLAASSARVSAGNSVVLVSQIYTRDTSSLFRVIIAFQDSNLYPEKDSYDCLKGLRSPY